MATKTSRDDMEVDLSVLRKPIATSVTGFVGVMRAYENGTPEMQRILEQECDVIYECKVCRNIFRDVANLMTHKRLFCKTAFNSKRDFHFPDHGFMDHNISTVIELENRTVNVESKKAYTDSLPKNLGGLLEKMRMKQVVAGTMSKSDYYELANNKVSLEDVMQQKHLLHLEEIPESSAAVYQTVQVENGTELEAIEKGEAIKLEVEEVHKLSTNSDTVVGPDGKAISLREFRDTCDKDAFEIGSLEELSMLYHYDEEAESKPHECAICDARFDTEKTLVLHIKLKHISSTKVYQCPSCSNTFSQAALVIRHLSNDHKKSLKKIRSMRETIHKRQMRQDEVQIKGPSRELNRLQTQKEREEAENNRAYLENVHNFDNTNQSMCTYCKKTFDRKAVMTSHMVSCRNKFEKMALAPSSSNAKPVVTDKTVAVYPGAKRGSKPTLSSTSSGTTNPVKENGAKDKELLQDENSSSTVISTDGSTTSSHLLETNNNNSNSTTRPEGSGSIDGDISNASSAKRKRKLNLGGLKVEASKKAKKDYMPSDLAGLLEKDMWGERRNDRDESYLSFEDAREAQEPRDSNTFKKRFSCETCNRTFSTMSNLKRHKQMVHYFNNQYQCKLCNYQTPKKYDTIEHLRVAHKMDQEDHELKTFVKQMTKEVSSSEQLDLDLEETCSNHARTTLINGRDNSGTNSPISNVSGNFNHIPPASTSAFGESASATPTVTPPPVPRRGRGRPKGSFKTQKPSRTTSEPPAIDRGVRSESKMDSDSSDFMDSKQKTVAIPSISPESQNNSGASTSSSSRPVRNRTKPKDKDFVYDLSHLKYDGLEYNEELLAIFTEALCTKKKGGEDAPSSESSLTPNGGGVVKRSVGRPKAKPKDSENTYDSKYDNNNVTYDGTFPSSTEKPVGGLGNDLPTDRDNLSVSNPKTKCLQTNSATSNDNNVLGSYKNSDVTAIQPKGVNWTKNVMIPTRIVEHRHSIDRPRVYNSSKKDETRRNSIHIMSPTKADVKENTPDLGRFGGNGRRVDQSDTEILKGYLREMENKEEMEEQQRQDEEEEINITLDRHFVTDTQQLSPREQGKVNSGFFTNGWSEIMDSEMQDDGARV